MADHASSDGDFKLTGAELLQRSRFDNHGKSSIDGLIEGAAEDRFASKRTVKRLPQFTEKREARIWCERCVQLLRFGPTVVCWNHNGRMKKCATDLKFEHLQPTSEKCPSDIPTTAASQTVRFHVLLADSALYQNVT